jgi:hypothetical protein
MTRTEAILSAVRALLEARRHELDAATDLRGVVLDLKFTAGHLEPRTVIDRIERERIKDLRRSA